MWRFDGNIRWIVALEAALFFSVPSWTLTVEAAWPANEAHRFALALFVGASVALVLSHVVPAMAAGALTALFESRIGRVLTWPIFGWLCVGAAASLLQLARTSGSMFVLWRDVPWRNEPVTWRAIAIVIAIGWIAMAYVLAATRAHYSLWAVALMLGIGFSLAISSLWMQSAGLHMKNPQLSNEDSLGDPFRMAEGMVIASAPASILALKIGRMRVSPRRVLWTGVCGLWLPLVFSVALVSLAKMAGARLFWKPSLPIGFDYAFVWIVEKTDSAPVFLWPLAITMAPPCIVCALWIRELTSGVHGPRLKPMVLTAIAVMGLVLARSAGWELYYTCWLWSIVAGSIAVCIFQTMARSVHSPAPPPP